MIDSNSQFFAILTAVGEAKQANATALGTPWTFKEMAVGDANGSDPIPNKAQTKLINEWRRAPVNQVRTDPANPNIIIAEQVIPPDVGGRWIREIGLFDADGDLVAVANCAPSFKPLLAQGTGKTQVIRMNFIVANTAQIVLKIDPAVVLATRKYVDDSLLAALPADKAVGTYRQVTIDKRGLVVSGSNPTTLSGYGISDGATKTELASAVSKFFPITGGRLNGSILLSSNTNDSPEFGWVTPSSEARMDLLNDNVRIFSEYGGEILTPLLLSLPNKTATVFGNMLWNSGNFDPTRKADMATTLSGYGITDAFTKAETYNRVDTEYLINLAVAALLPKRSFAVSDFIRIPDQPGGLILQFGTFQVGPETTVDLPLPVSFNTHRGCVASLALDAANNTGNYAAYGRLISPSVIRLTQDVSTTMGATTQWINYLAWGN